ncbi:hypothetical protein BAU15_07295 [Enterococcus sp. JM4C]|uniref:rhodanese-like domain-containing protein n=1 Tax=Candidatus Enterococcus huntleyi TaxID=1857217 RepID=UPI00137B6C62|nr:rhodanese-like domain-containing protein [Enterococcus sp. JM4C]KAF1297512.1 hypothetical protein BAU15_07295 [Enterococcus sp. JM4C]
MLETIMMPEFYQLTKQKDVKIIDVREEDEYAAGHLPTAENYPLSQLATSFVTLQKDDHYYVICHSGGRSAGACDFLASHGYQVTNVLGGTAGWLGELV